MSNEMLDAFTRHQIFLQRFAAGEGKKVDPYIKTADRLMREILLDAGEDIPTKKALSEVTRAIRSDVGSTYDEYVELLLSDMDELAEAEAAFTVRTMESGVDVVVASPELPAVLRAVYTTPMAIGGTMPDLLRPFTASWSVTETQRINKVITKGFIEGNTTAQMVREIRGTRANRFKDGILETSRRNAQAIARTAVNHTATQARESTYRANDDILDGVEWSSTLDNKTSAICRRYDGQIFPVDEGPRPPAHVSCRSATIPAVKPELSLFAGNEERVAVGADGPETSTVGQYYTWLRTQPAAFQNEVLGVSQGKLFRNGGLSPDEFRKLTTTNFGKPLTLAEIKAKDSTAWNKANLD